MKLVNGCTPDIPVIARTGTLGIKVTQTAENKPTLLPKAVSLIIIAIMKKISVN